MVLDKKYIKYKNKTWLLVREFMTGNGTYDMVMYELSNGEESIIIADLDIEHEEIIECLL